MGLQYKCVKIKNKKNKKTRDNRVRHCALSPLFFPVSII